jgi:hypothetical protein
MFQPNNIVVTVMDQRKGMDEEIITQGGSKC